MFKTYKIKSGPWYAEISSDLGANITMLRYDGKDVFVPLKNLKQLEENPYIQGAPILLPANRTAGGKFSFENTEYLLPVNEINTGAHLHGFVHKQKFEIVEHTQEKVSCVYENKGEVYPFDFRLTVTYAIENDSFIQRYVIKNLSSGRMPFTFALHTSFVEPDVFSVPIDACQKKNEKHIPVGGYVQLNEQEGRYVTGSPSKDIVISGYYRSCGSTARVGDFEYTVSDNFDHWILFNGSGKKGLLCVEPQCGAVNGLNIDNGCVQLEAGEEIHFATNLSRF